jgi:membrane-bound serine protease (ClpP class)
MDILFNPNVAYILLVLGFLLALFAIVTPGTGLLEVGAFFCVAVAGFAIYRIGFNLWALILLVLALVPYIYAIRKPKREWALALSLVAIIIGSVYMFPSTGFNPSVNPIVAIVVSLLLAGFLWFLVRKTVAAFARRPNHDLEALIGQTGEAKTRVTEEGSVQASGELWSARSEKPIPAGSRVRIIGREGFILLVKLDEPLEK